MPVLVVLVLVVLIRRRSVLVVTAIVTANAPLRNAGRCCSRPAFRPHQERCPARCRMLLHRRPATKAEPVNRRSPVVRRADRGCNASLSRIAPAGASSCTVPAGPCGTPMPDLPCQHLTSARCTRTPELRRALCCCCAAPAFQGTADRMRRAPSHIQPLEARDNPHHHHHAPAGRRSNPDDKPPDTW